MQQPMQSYGPTPPQQQYGRTAQPYPQQPAYGTLRRCLSQLTMTRAGPVSAVSGGASERRRHAWLAGRLARRHGLLLLP